MVLELADKIKSKKIKIGIIGLGYVGLPLCIRFAQVGFKVIGFDRDKKKVHSLNNHKSYIKSIKNSDIKKIKKNFVSTSNFSIISDVDIIIICLPTPLKKNTKSPDMTYIKGIAKIIKNKLRENQAIILESTTYPGTSREFFVPIINQRNFILGKNFYLIYSPEREDPGNKKYKIQHIPKIVSGYTKNCKKIAKLVYQKVAKKTVLVKTLEHAEMVKLYENIYRSINIGLANEMKLICNRMGLNVFEVIKAASTKPFGFSAFFPGPGYGGHCIPVDPFYLSWKSKKFGYNPKFIELSGKVNNKMPNFIKSNIKKIFKNSNVKKIKILILGIAYKKNVDDLRESPAIQLINILKKEKKYLINFYDPYIKKIQSRNKQFKNIKYFELNYPELKKFDLVAIITDHDVLNYKKILKHSKMIIDCRGKFFNINNKKVIQS